MPSVLFYRAHTRLAVSAVALVLLAGISAALTVNVASAAAGPATALSSSPVTGPNLIKGSAYLVSPSNLVDGHYYEAFPGFADFGLTIDGAFALAATGDRNSALQTIVTFLADNGMDASGSTVDSWTGIGTPFASGGALGKEALLAEIVGDDPHHFGGHDLIATLGTSVCLAASTGTDTSCAAAGNYTYTSSTFSQALGIMAQLRAGDAAGATTPVSYLESLQHADGSFPSLLPDSGDSDVDSTAMAVMALALVPDATATGDVLAGIAWIAGRQEKDGGFPGAAGDSVNSAALAIQALTLNKTNHQPQIDAALTFLATQQNSDGGFNAASDGQPGSDLRASTQAVGGAVGTPFGTLRVDLSVTPSPTPSKTPAPRPTVTVTHTHTQTAIITVTATTTVTVSPAPSAVSSESSNPASTTAPAPSPSQPMALASAGDTVELWWIVVAVGVVGAAVVGVLYLRRRRLYPTVGRHAGPVDGTGS